MSKIGARLRGLPMLRDFVVSIHDIGPSGRELDGALDESWLNRTLGDTEIKAVSGEPGTVHARLSLSGRDVVVRGWVKVPVVTPCARCLQPARVVVDTELTLLLAPGPAASSSAPAKRARDAQESRHAGSGAAERKAHGKAKRSDVDRATKSSRGTAHEAYEFASDEADTDTYEGEEVVLDGFIRELILLEMPIFPLCSEQCPGIGAIPEVPGGA